MIDGDDKLSKRYRELGREEPPRALDEAILASARRAVAPRTTQRWAMPVSIAAVLVLATGVTLRMQQEQPGIETAAPASEYSLPPASPEPSPAPATKAQEADARAMPATKAQEADAIAMPAKKAPQAEPFATTKSAEAESRRDAQPKLAKPADKLTLSEEKTLGKLEASAPHRNEAPLPDDSRREK